MNGVYQIFGLTLRSCWKLSLPSSEAREAVPPDLELLEGTASLFSLAQARAETVSLPGTGCRYAFLPDGSTYLCWDGLFEFLIPADGHRLVGRSLGGDSWESFQTYLLGQVLSFALLQQGIEPLHCTVLAVNGGAVGFLGDCGSGKSSLAAAFLKAGYPLLTDDLLVLRDEGQGFLAYPSFPRIKLFPEVARAFLGDRITGSPMNPYTPKLIIPLGAERYCQTSLPLKALFVLRQPTSRSKGKRITIRPRAPRRAFFDIIANTFNTRVTAPERLQRQFALAARLTRTVPIRSLSYPRDLAQLPEVVKAIQRSLA